MKEIRIFSNPNNVTLTQEVNNFLNSTEYKVIDIQYGISGGLFSQYSVMIVIEVNTDA